MWSIHNEHRADIKAYLTLQNVGGNMSAYMDEIDQEFISSLFPEYLLQQPITYYLWSAYFRQKKLFHKIKHCKNDRTGTNLISNEYNTERLPKRLSHSVRKEVWQKLMNLGVLGTLSFDSVSDEYLIQAHKYFYPGISENASSGVIFDTTKVKNADANNTKDSNMAERNNTSYLNTSNGEDRNEHVEDIDDDADVGTGEDESPDSAENEEELENDEDDAEEGNGSSPLSRESSNTEPTSFYPALKNHKYPSTSRNNSANSDIYRLLDYNLPSEWVTQASNSILLSGDGISQLQPNPNWQSYMTYERSNYSTRNRLRNSLSGNQKNNFAVTWANNPVNSNRLGIFYYEIRVLSVTSSQGAQNSNIIVGYKSWSDSDAETAPQRGDNEPTPVTGQTSDLEGNIRTSLRSSSSTSESTGHGSESNKLGVDEGFFGYCGSDGSITASSQSKTYSKPFGRDDVIGCGVNFINGTIFFTKNGICLGTAFTDLYDFNLIPYIALKPGNSVKTNFGLYENFLFDIAGYQERWKARSYKHIFKSIDNEDITNEFESDEEDSENDVHNKNAMEDQMDIDADEIDNQDDNIFDPKSLLRDNRYENDQLCKPDVEKLNTLSTSDDSIPITLHTMINEYLIHEGLIDVAKGFLKDLKKNDIRENGIESRSNEVISHNERQIIKEEKNLNIRQELRRFVTHGNISECLRYIQLHLPGLLEKNQELLFELKMAQYLLTISNHKEYSIEKIVAQGQELSKEFVFDTNIPQDLREKFQTQLSNVSALLAYEDPLNEPPEELTAYLSNDYLKDRLFQTVNTSVLAFLQKNNECELENIIRHTRAMLKTLMNYDAEGSSVRNGAESRYFKVLNLDEDLLSL